MTENRRSFKRTSSIDDDSGGGGVGQIGNISEQQLTSILVNSHQRKTPLLKRINSQSNSSSSTINSGREINFCEVYYLSPSKRKSKENLEMTPNQSMQRRQQMQHKQYSFQNNNNSTDSILQGKAEIIKRRQKAPENVFGYGSRGVTSIISGGNSTTNEPLILDNFDVCSHYSDSGGTIQKPLYLNSGINSASVIGSGNLLGVNNSRTSNVTFSTNNFISNEERQKNINLIASTASISHSNRGSLKRSKGRSSQSLCSCDAGEETEFDKNPNRPLYQYSLDRKKKAHTYSCEQNAQILLRLERDKLLRKNSLGGGGASGKYPERQGNELNYIQNGSCDETSFDYPDLNNSIESDSTSTDAGESIPPPPPPPSISLNRSKQQSQQHLSINKDILISNDLLHKQKMQASSSSQSHLPTTPRTHSTTLKSNIGSIGESMLNDCTQTILNCANAGQMIINNAAATVIGREATTIKQQQQPDLCQTPNNKFSSHHHSHYHPNNGQIKNHGHDAFPYIRDDSYMPYLKKSKTDGKPDEDSVFFYHQELPYTPNFDNRPSFIGASNIATNNAIGNIPSKFNTIGPSNCYTKNHNYQPNGYCNHSLVNSSGRYFSQSLTNFSDWHQQQQQQQQHHHMPYTRIPLVKNDLSCSFGGTTSGLCTDLSTNLNSSSFTTLGSCSASGLKVTGSGSGKELHQQKHYHSHHHHSHQPQSGLSRSLSSFMPWKYRQCSNSTNSGTSSSLKFDLSKHWLAVSSILLLIGAASVAVPLALRVAASAPFQERLQIATQLLDSVPLIDGHNDLPWNIRKFLHNKLNDFNFDEDLRNVMPWAKSHWSHTDLQRLKSGRVSAQFWAAYVPCEAQHRDAVQLTLEQIDVIKRLTERYSPQLTTCTSASDIIEAHKGHKLCSLTGVEGGHSLGGSLAVLRTLYGIGVRYMTLTSTCHTPWADSSYADAPTFNIKHGGLTPFGKTIIREMNRLGMIVDLSHVSTGTMRDALATSEAPVIFSHSSAYELCNSSRNVQDDILISLAKNGGLVMVNFYSKFLSCNENSTVHDAVAHINHIKKIAGIDHVGLGAGFDGINFTPKGLEDVSTYPTLFAELLGEGWSIEDLKKLAGENFLRVMTAVEKIRDEKKKAGIKPFEDHPNFRTEDPYNCTSS